MNRVVEFALRNRFLILVFTLVVLAVGIWAMRVLPVDVDEPAPPPVMPFAMSSAFT